MVDLTPQDRLTRKRNLLLQKQLEFQLQILNEEYRLTKKDMEKTSREAGSFLVCLRHTVPGLSMYGQPDTRAMNGKNILLERRFMGEDDRPVDSLNPEEHLLYRSMQKRTGRADSRLKRSGSREENKGEREKQDEKPKSAASSRNEFFNKRIALDCRRRSFLQHVLKGGGEGGGGKTLENTIAPCPPENPRLLGGAVTHAGFMSNRDTQGEISTMRRPKTTPRTHRSRTPRYGQDAYSKQEESVRKHILKRFDVIFDPQNEKPQGKIRTATPAATPVAILKSDHESRDTSGGVQSERNGKHQSSYILNRRVAWSAPPKRQESPISTVATVNANRDNQSVTPRSGTAMMVRNPPRPHSSMSMVSQVSTENDGDSQMSTLGLKARGLRPKTAPPNYELKQRTMAAPRQQVAGILAEIQSRRADTRALLIKSKQLKQMVKMLAPPEEHLDDSFSD